MICIVFFFKQKTAYEMRISDWSSDVCSSDLRRAPQQRPQRADDVRDVDIAGRDLVEHRCEEKEVVATDQRDFDVTLAEIGRASCRERVCQYVSIQVVAVSLNKKPYHNPILHYHNTPANNINMRDNPQD